MAIQTVGSLQDILKNHKSKSWVKSAEMNGLGDNFKWTKELDSLVGQSVPGNQSFGELLADSIGEVNSLQHQANESIQKLVTGENKNIHDTMLKVEQAEIAFKTMNQIRQKVLDAYREVMKMQV